MGWAPHTFAASIQDMRINHCGAHVPQGFASKVMAPRCLDAFAVGWGGLLRESRFTSCIHEQRVPGTATSRAEAVRRCHRAAADGEDCLSRVSARPWARRVPQPSHGNA